MCQYAYPQEGSTARKCPHPDYGNSHFCVFHHPSASLKALDFEEAFEAYLRAVATHPQVNVLDFEGFVFPALTLGEHTFYKAASFRSARFVGPADFRSTRFARNVDFRGATFAGMADFQQAAFSGHSDFSRAVFSGLSSFQRATFSGFTAFHQTRFSGPSTFQAARFSGIATFRRAAFLGQADFREACFAGMVYFPDVLFEAPALFQGATFRGNVDFQHARFEDEARFQMARFSGNTRFQHARFEDEARFRMAAFSGNTGFQQATFSGAADFQRAIFRQRVDFHRAQFHDTVDFGQAHFTLLRHLPAAASGHPVLLEGAVLEAASFPDGAVLSGYCFRNAFLIGISLAGKRLENCDFTGAVLYHVHTDGWQPDAQTLHNTRYIYTDYQRVEVPDPAGTSQCQYQPLEASRVPAEGAFGDLEHHQLTLASCFSQPYRWHTTLLLPDEIRTPVLGALFFFCEYLRKTGPPAEVYLQVTPEGPWVRLVFLTDQASVHDQLAARFKTYVRDLFRPLDEATLPLPHLSDFEKAAFCHEYRTLRQRMQQDLQHQRMHARQRGNLRAYEADLVAAFRPFFENGQAADPRTVLELLQGKPTNSLPAEP